MSVVEEVVEQLSPVELALRQENVWSVCRAAVGFRDGHSDSYEVTRGIEQDYERLEQLLSDEGVPVKKEVLVGMVVACFWFVNHAEGFEDPKHAAAALSTVVGCTLADRFDL